jgi:hypothetical protein
VAEAVIDVLETVDVEEEQREGPAGLALRPGEGEPKSVGEDSAVRQLGQRIVETADSGVGVRVVLAVDVGLPADDSVDPTGVVAQHFRAGQHPAVAAIAVADPVAVLERGDAAGDVRVDHAAQSLTVVGMDELEPVVRRLADLAALVAEHLLPAGRVVDLAAPDVPVPDAVLLAAAGDDKPVERGAQRPVGLDDLRPRAQPLGEKAQLGPDGRGLGRKRQVIVAADCEQLLEGCGGIVGNQCEDRRPGTVGGAQSGEQGPALLIRQPPIDKGDDGVRALGGAAALPRAGEDGALVAGGLDLGYDGCCELPVGARDHESQRPRRRRRWHLLGRGCAAHQPAEDLRQPPPAHRRRLRSGRL